MAQCGKLPNAYELGRQVNVDYSICQALAYRTVPIGSALIIYDVACQWSRKFHSRVENSSFLSLGPISDLQWFALCKAHVNFESETKSPSHEHNFSSISRWIALKIEICTYLKISEVLPYSFSHEILSNKIVSDRLALNSRTQFRDNGGLLAFDM